MKKGKDESGAVLVVSLWILIILTLLAVSIGRRTSIELRLSRYNLNSIQAFYLAKAGLERIYIEKLKDAKENNYDALYEDWSNKLNAAKDAEFKDFSLGAGKFTLKYKYYESKSKQPDILYGLQDEQSKLNINKIIKDNDTVDIFLQIAFVKLLEQILEIDNVQAEELVDKFIDWIDNDSIPMPKGKEDYSESGVIPKNKPLDTREELLMIEGFGLEKFNKLANYITIYGEGLINVNTASFEVLTALGLGSRSCQNIIDYRNGPDGQIATSDDKAITALSELTDRGLILSEDSDLINELINTPRITVESRFYSANSSAAVNNITREISTVIEIKPDKKNIAVLYWYEE